MDNKGYKYTRENGTTEYAVDASDAIRQCPVLGAMSAEQAGLVLDLLNDGQGSENSEEITETWALDEDQEDEIKLIEVKKLTPFQYDDQSSVPERTQTKKDKDTDIVHDHVVQETAHDSTPSVATIKSPILVNEELQTPRVDSEQSEPLESRIDVAPTLAEPENNFIPEVQVESEPININKKSQGTDEQEVSPVNVVVSPKVTINQEAAETSPKVEIIREDEAQKTFEIVKNLIMEIKEQVHEIPYVKETVAELPLADTKAKIKHESESRPKLEQQPEVIVLEVAPAEGLDINPFEEYVEAQSEVETMAKPELEHSMDTIIAETTNEQPVEEVFMELAEALKDSPPEAEEVYVAVKDLSESLSYSKNVDAERDTVEISPETIQKLLDLLRLLGYENPQRALIELLSRYDLEFLVQAIRHLAQMTNADNRQSFSLASTVAAVSQDKTTTQTHLGRLLFALVARANFELAA